MRKTISIVLALLAVRAACCAQTSKGPDLLQFTAAGGFPSRETQVKGPLHHYTVSVSRQYDKESLYGYYGLGGFYPSLGISLGAYHYDRASFPGGTPYSNHYTLSVHYEQPVWNAGRWSLTYLMEEGFGYTQDCYDPVRNPESTYGGHFHIAYHMAALFSYDISQDFRISFGPSYAHHSNSKTYIVNTGCDSMSAEFALTYFCRPMDRQSGQVTVAQMGVRERYWDVQYGACVTGGGPDKAHPRTYVSNRLGAAHLWRTFRRAALGLGADAFFDKGGNENRNAYGLCGAADYYMTRNLSISAHLGAYLNGRARNTSPVYETIGLSYSFGPGGRFVPYVGFSTKANAGKAENLALQIGIRI